MTTANRDTDDHSAERARTEGPTIVVTLSVVDVQLRRRTEPAAAISWEGFFGPELATPGRDPAFANGQEGESGAPAAGTTGEPLREGLEPGTATDAEPYDAPAWLPVDQSRGGEIYTAEMADRIAGELRALPAIDRRRLGKQAVVRFLKEEISAVQRRGYTLEEIAEQFTAMGLEITAPTLKNYLHRAKKRSGKRATKGSSLPLVLTEGVS